MSEGRRKPSRRSVGAVRSAESEAAIINAATRILRKQGYSGLTVEAVARTARASKPTIYKWWGTKTQLVFDAYTKSIVIMDPYDLGDVRLELVDYFQRLWKVWSDPKLASISLGLMADAFSNSELLAAYRSEYVPKRESPLIAILRRAVNRGQLARDLDIDFAATALCGPHMYSLIKGRPMPDETIELMVDVVLCGLSAGSAVNGAAPVASRDVSIPEAPAPSNS